MKFQKEIEKAACEKSRFRAWERKKSTTKNRLGSMDSLLSLDSDHSFGAGGGGRMFNNSNNNNASLGFGHPLPPKGKFVSTDALLTTAHAQSSVPPQLPPKQRIQNRAGNGQQKRVSISSAHASLRAVSSDELSSGEARTRGAKESVVVSDVVAKQRSVEDDNSGAESDNSLVGLPSVKELASKFGPAKAPQIMKTPTVPKPKPSNNGVVTTSQTPAKSPTPAVRKSLNEKVRGVIFMVPKLRWHRGFS